MLSYFYTICEGGVVGVMTLGAEKYGAKTMAEKKWQRENGQVAKFTFAIKKSG